jgi:hypothetical protein
MDKDFNFEHHLSRVKATRKGQRNWDHSKTLPIEKVEQLVQVAINAPAKQDEAFFDLYVLTNRQIIREMYLNHSWGFNQDKDVNYRNPQIDAHAVFVFARATPPTNRNDWIDGSQKVTQPFSRSWVNCLEAIGIASGYVSLTASLMGLTIGYSKNFFFQPQSHTKWCEVLGHREPCHPDADPDSYVYGHSEPAWEDPYSGGNSTIVHMMGIGYPDESLKWYQNKDTQYMTSDPKDNIVGDVDSLSLPGIVHELDQDVIEYSTYSHDPETNKSIDRPHKVKWIK